MPERLAGTLVNPKGMTKKTAKELVLDGRLS